jgi:arabinofuranosyltransferase
MMAASPAEPLARPCWRHAWLYVPLLVAVELALCWYFSRFALIDDAFIAFRYARNLLQGNGLVFNVGDRTEGYTCFLWVILLSVPMKLGISPVLASQVLGSTFLALALAAVATFFPSHESRPTWSRLVAPAIFAANAACAFWAVHGLETVMFMALLTMAVRRDCRDHAAELFQSGWSGLWYALAALTRPEGTLAFIASLMFWIGRRPRLLATKSLWRHVLTFAAPVVAHLLWRLFYYGDLVPNTYHAKVGLSLATLSRGWRYVFDFWTGSGGYVLLVALPAVAAARRDLRLAFTAWMVLAFFGLTIATGGDASTGWRFVIPVVPILCVLAGEGFRELLDIALAAARSRAARAALVSAGCAFAIFGTGAHAVRTFEVAQRTAVENGQFTHDLILAGLAMRRYLPGDTRIALNPAGAIPYYSRLYAYDMLGLTDSHIGHRVQAGMGKGYAGHEKGDGAYILDQRPEIILFGNVMVVPAGPIDWSRIRWQAVLRSESEMATDPRLAALYVPDRLPLDDGRNLIFLRRRDFTIPVHPG